MDTQSLYDRLGGYDAIAAMVGELVQRLRGDARLGHYWQDRSEDNLLRSRQLLIDFICAGAGGPVYYMGRDMKTSHKGMGISEGDWSALLDHLHAVLAAFRVPQAERDEVVAFVQGTKADMVETRIWPKDSP